jgi:hypothetical protein
VALRGHAAIDRAKRITSAKVRDPLLMVDILSTMQASRAKMLFTDDSVLTMGERSRLVVEEYMHREGKGKSVINLLDGKMRTIVGRNDFEVHTPTAIAAARGTVILFETGVRNGRRYTIIICIEGTVIVKSTDPNIKGSVRLTPGMMLTVFEAEPLPIPIQVPEIERDRLLAETDMRGFEISMPEPVVIDTGVVSIKDADFRRDIGAEDVTKDIAEDATTGDQLPPFQQEPEIRSTPVNVEVIHP